ncbi:ice-binding family protein [Frankia sp. AiPs1]|uniref:ice-binding family protein n=1 Tax=Frankia sp. AiPs1 TaxID=573493 RepID=UPI0020446F3A|nr:ice-binding family protein [Frankia sp. AiPs1]MCM3921319.1 ice-binding family protein [Frankia sp. AiPs1]
MSAISGRRRLTRAAVNIALTAAAGALVVGGQPRAQAARIARPAPVEIGSVQNFAVLAAATVTNSGASHVIGDIGVSPGTAVTGFPPGTLDGMMHGGDPVATQAQSDLNTAYNDAAARTPTAIVSGDLGGLTLAPGVYHSISSLGIAGTLTLDGQGHPNAVFIFQMGSTLITSADARVELVGGAQACNVFWQVGSSATLAANSVIVGDVAADQSITVAAGTSINGRALARGAAVTLAENAITRADCNPPGTLGISAPTGPVSLGTVPLSSARVAGQLGTVTVTDNRDIDPAGWITTVSSTAFVSGPSSISPSNASYSPGEVTLTGDDVTPTVTNVPALSLAPGEIVRATGGTGLNSAAWNPTVTVTIPAVGIIAGTYSATLTHSVA